MKVLSYNTLFGGFDGTQRDRYEAQIALIGELAPDVLLMQEARNFQANGQALLLETERRLGLRGFLGIASHTGQNTAIFIAPHIQPLAVEVDDIHFHHARLSLKARVPGFAAPVTFLSVHLSPTGAHVRLREATYLIDIAAPGNLALIGGDFNSISPHDGIPGDLAALPAHFRLRYTDPDGVSPDGSPLQLLETAGLVDIGQRTGKIADATVPTAGFKGTEFATFRSDYFLASPALAEHLRDYRVIKNAITDAASDHYPIWAELGE